MNRRQFLRGLVSGLAITTIYPQWPFRVYSFSKTIISTGLTQSQLEEAYHNVMLGYDVMFGYDEPDIMIINKLSAKYIIPKLDDEIFKPSLTWWALKAKYPDIP